MSLQQLGAFLARARQEREPASRLNDRLISCRLRTSWPWPAKLVLRWRGDGFAAQLRAEEELSDAQVQHHVAAATFRA